MLDKLQEWLGRNGLVSTPYRDWSEYLLREYLPLVDVEVARLREVVQRQEVITEGIADLIMALPQRLRKGTTSSNATHRALAYIRELETRLEEAPDAE